MPTHAVTPWIVFHVLLLCLLGAETLLLRRQTPQRAYIATALWVLGALVYGGYLYGLLGHGLAQEFFAGYALEESLSIDNLFVFLLLFQSAGIVPDRQRRVLFWGILGAVVLRAAFIVAGMELLTRFEWITYVFAVLLLVAAVRLVLPQDHAAPKKPRWQQWIERRLTFSDSQDGFFVQENGHTAPTILLFTLIAVAVTDFIFALDSIPAVLSITRHTLIAYTSNILAVMGLRSLFFVLAHALSRLRYLHYGLAAVLAFAAVKMLIAHWYQFSALASLAVIFGVLAFTIGVSLVLARRQGRPA